MKFTKQLSFNTKRVDIVWQDKDKTQVKLVENRNGKYIIGCDPAFIPNLWQKLWMNFGFFKKHKSNSSIIRIYGDGSLKNCHMIYYKKNK
jgi:hypothetical protein